MERSRKTRTFNGFILPMIPFFPIELETKVRRGRGGRNDRLGKSDSIPSTKISRGCFRFPSLTVGNGPIGNALMAIQTFGTIIVRVTILSILLQYIVCTQYKSVRLLITPMANDYSIHFCITYPFACPQRESGIEGSLVSYVFDFAKGFCSGQFCGLGRRFLGWLVCFRWRSGRFSRRCSGRSCRRCSGRSCGRCSGFSRWLGRWLGSSRFVGFWNTIICQRLVIFSTFTSRNGLVGAALETNQPISTLHEAALGKSIGKHR